MLCPRLQYLIYLHCKTGYLFCPSKFCQNLSRSDKRKRLLSLRAETRPEKFHTDDVAVQKSFDWPLLIFDFRPQVTTNHRHFYVIRMKFLLSNLAYFCGTKGKSRGLCADDASSGFSTVTKFRYKAKNICVTKLRDGTIVGFNRGLNGGVLM